MGFLDWLAAPFRSAPASALVPVSPSLLALNAADTSIPTRYDDDDIHTQAMIQERHLQDVERAADTATDMQLLRVMRGTIPPRRGSAAMLESYRMMPWLRSVVSRRSDGIAGVQFQVFKKRKTFDPSRLSRAHQGDGRDYDQLVRFAVQQGELELLSADPLITLLNNPSSFFGRHAFWKLVPRYLDLVGEAFILKERDGLGRVVGLAPIAPTWVKAIPDGNRRSYLVQHNAFNREVAVEDMIYIRDPDVWNPYERGSGTGFALGDELETDEYAARLAKGRFLNNNVPDAVISVKGRGGEQVKNMEARWNDRAQGFERKGKALFVGDEVSIQTIGHTLVESDYVELRKMLRDFVMQTFGVPPEVVGIVENSNRATIDAAFTLFAKLCVVPTMELICDELNRSLSSEFGDDLVITYANPVPADQAFQLEVMKAAPHAFSVNEYRTLAGMPTLTDGDVVVASATGIAAYQSPALIQPIPASSPAVPTQTETPSARTTSLPKVRHGGAKSRFFSLLALQTALEVAISSDLMWELLAPIFVEMMQEYGVKQALEMGGELTPTDSTLQRIIEEERRRFSDIIDATTRDELKDLLQPIVGKSVEEQRRVIEDYFASPKTEARQQTIGATETVVASEKAVLRAMQSAKIVEREWISTRDSRTRDSHRTLDGQRTSLLGDFVIRTGKHAGRRAKTPATFGIASEDIYCRCAVGIVLPEDDSRTHLTTHTRALTIPADASESQQETLRAALWERADGARRPWEKRILEAVQAGMRKQADALLEQL